MIIGHVLPDKETSLVDAYEKCRALADPKVCCDYALHVGITWWAPKVTALWNSERRTVVLWAEGPVAKPAVAWCSPAYVGPPLPPPA